MNESIDINKIRKIRWADNILPLSDERYPFRSWSDNTILCFIEYMRKFPNSTGRLPLLIKEYLDIPNICSERFIMKEAHIDISECDNCLKEKIISLGFEPDHFKTLNPAEYTKCFTMRIETNPFDRAEIKRVHNYMKESLLYIQGIIDSIKGVFSYTELETYSDRLCKKYKFRAVDEIALSSFPFFPNEFVLTSGKYKKADIHVKLPASNLKGKEFEGAESTEMLILRQLFIMSGFYEIRSLSGNIIYTLQLLDMKIAKLVFNSLLNWANEYGGVSFIVMEIIDEFWRKEEDLNGKMFCSPIPRVVRRAY